MFQIIKSQYGDTTIKRLHRFEKLDYRFRKVVFEKKIDFECLVICRNNNVIPRFLHICLGNKSSDLLLLMRNVNQICY